MPGSFFNYEERIIFNRPIQNLSFDKRANVDFAADDHFGDEQSKRNTETMAFLFYRVKGVWRFT